MKKHLVILCGTVVATGFAASAQSIFVSPDNKAYFGARVGLDIACPGSITSDHVSVDAFNSGAGIEFGGIYHLPVIANMYVEPGLKLYYDTYSMKKNVYELMDVKRISVRKFGFRIPVMAGYHFDFTNNIKVSVFTGPELEVGLAGKARGQISNIETAWYKWDLYGDDGEFNRVNLLWDFGASVSWNQWSFGITGGVGMLNINNESDPKFHENRVTMSLGYDF